MTVLIVDDNEILLYTRKLILQSAGFHVLAETSGLAALATFVSHDIDIAVLDYHLPDTDGERLCNQMKEIKPDVPVIIASGRYPDVDSECSDYFMLKGGSPQLLVQKIIELTKRAA